MKRLTVLVGIAALLLGLGIGYYFHPEATMWMAEMGIGEALVTRSLDGGSEIIFGLAKEGQWYGTLLKQRANWAAVERLLVDIQVAQEMAEDPRYDLLTVEQEYPFIRIVNVDVTRDVMEIWIWADTEMMQALYETREGRMNALLEASGATIKTAHERFPEKTYVFLFWAVAREMQSIEGPCTVIMADIHFAGGKELFAWAENPTYDGLDALLQADKVDAIAYGWFAEPRYCTEQLSRLSNDQNPWMEKE